MSAARPTQPIPSPDREDTSLVRDAVRLETRRRTAVAMLESGVPQAEVARRVGVSRAAVCQWKKAVAARGAAGLRALPRSGRPALIPRDRSAEIAELVRRGPRSVGVPADRWSAARIRAFVETRWGLRVSDSTLRRWMRRHEIRWDRDPSRGPNSRESPSRAEGSSSPPPVTPMGSRPPFVQYILAFDRGPSEPEERAKRDR